jgi:hypothetical protein
MVSEARTSIQSQCMFLAAEMAYSIKRSRKTKGSIYAIEHRGRAYQFALKLCELGCNESDVRELIYQLTSK